MQPGHSYLSLPEALISKNKYRKERGVNGKIKDYYFLKRKI